MDAIEITARATLVYAVLTGGILGVLIWAGSYAKKQLQEMRRNSRHLFVKNLMEQWSTSEMIGARDTIDTMLRQELRKHKVPELKEERLKFMGQCLIKILVDLEDEKSYVVRHLLNIPHYFEMVSTLVKRDPDSLEEVLTLFRDSILYWYELFSPYIEKERKKWESKEILKEFEKLKESALTFPKEET